VIKEKKRKDPGRGGGANAAKAKRAINLTDRRRRRTPENRFEDVRYLGASIHHPLHVRQGNPRKKKEVRGC